jgi:predicted aspartyl protease
MDIRTFLDRAGYDSAPLSPSAVGHLHVEGRLNDHPVTVLIDTGASDTVVDEAFARSEGFELKRDRRSGGGAGAARLAVHSIRQAQLSVGGIEVATDRLFVLDLSHVAAALARKGVSPPQVILGADVLKQRSAVIDYASGRLFFAPAGPGAA